MTPFNYPTSRCVWKHSGLAMMLLGVLLLSASPMLQAQTFDSGSTGADGALDLTGSPPNTVIDFDPTTFTPPLDPDGDSIYHFTTITVPAGVTLRFRANRAGAAPIQWLASGAIVIDGTLDLDGESGHDSAQTTPRLPSIPGPGGFAGGPGGRAPNIPAQAGFGPGGGPSFNGFAGNASYATGGRACQVSPKSTYGNAFLLPLIGGSGGGGGGSVSVNGSGGGAGGGAILLASSVSISIDGAILARGGVAGTASGFSAGSGSGGAIRLVAPVITGAGALNALGGDGFSCQDGGQGRIRVEALEHLFTGTSSGDSRRVTLLPNPVIVTTVPLPQIRVVSIGGVAVSPNPLGNLDPVDVTIDTAQQVNVDLEAQHIPPGTTIVVTIYNETDGTSTANSSPLTGTDTSSTATATILIPAGYSRVFTNAQWTTP